MHSHCIIIYYECQKILQLRIQVGKTTSVVVKETNFDTISDDEIAK
jgi:hypothetical protein